jgi:hypothetical protein
MKRVMFTVLAAMCLGAAACSEQSGENMDSAVEEATQGHENPGDGPLERAGEAVDEATGNTTNNDPADAINDATDGNPSTQP